MLLLLLLLLTLFLVITDVVLFVFCCFVFLFCFVFFSFLLFIYLFFNFSKLSYRLSFEIQEIGIRGVNGLNSYVPWFPNASNNIFLSFDSLTHTFILSIRNFLSSSFFLFLWYSFFFFFSLFFSLLPFSIFLLPSHILWYLQILALLKIVNSKLWR